MNFQRVLKTMWCLVDFEVFPGDFSGDVCGVQLCQVVLPAVFVVVTDVVTNGSCGRRHLQEEDPCLVAVVGYSLSRIRIVLIEFSY
jgi:hypothetical protein